MGKTALVRIREGIALGDLDFEGHAEAVATYLVETRDGVVVVDPGPWSCTGPFRESLRLFGCEVADLRHLLLTHIHLDHAGAAGALAREVPGLRVHVHRVGAPHLADPTRLLTSARRIYGDDMDRLWGACLPVPRDQLAVLDGGECLTIGGRHWRVAATPGHAIHHVAYLDEREGLAFTGDVAGEGTRHGTPPLPAAPPPDIDLDTWCASLDVVAQWRPEELLLTHFGAVSDPGTHLQQIRDRLMDWATLVGRSLEEPGSDDARAARFADAEWARLTSGLTADQAAWVQRDTIEHSWYGLARYWRRRVAVDA